MNRPEPDKPDTKQPDLSHHPLVDDDTGAHDNRPLTLRETLMQAISLIFQLQKKQGLKRATDLLESNPGSMILAGVMAAGLFFTFCFVAMKTVLYFAGV